MRIEVWDSGIGIPGNKTNSIFNEYKQLKPNLYNSVGLGLGLAIVDRMAKLLKHSVKVRSIVGRGSVFSVELPYGDLATLAVTNDNLMVEYNNLVDIRILVIDDDPSIIYGMRNILRNWGCDVITASSYHEAIKCVQNLHGNLCIVISDMQLQGIQSGINTIKHIQKLLPNSVLGIVITGQSPDYMQQHAQNNDYPILYKPVAPSKLRSLIGYLLSENSSTQKNSKPLLEL